MWSFLAVATKEFLHFGRNKLLIRMMFALQMLHLVMLGFIDTSARDLPTVVVDQDVTSDSRELVAKLKAARTFDIKFLTSSTAQGRDHVRAGRARVALVIPPDYHRERLLGSARVLALVDGTDSFVSTQAVAALGALAARLDVEEVDTTEEPRPLRVHSMQLFNPEGKTANFILPGLLPILLAGAFMLLSGSSLVREREEGTLERILMAPVSFSGLMFGKLVPYFVAAIVNQIVLVAAMRFVFGVPLNGSLVALSIAFVLYALVTLALGVFLAAGARTQTEVGARQMLIQTANVLISGYVFPLSSLPSFLLPVAYALPATHLIEVLRGITLRGASLSDLWMDFLYLALAPVVLLVGAVLRFRSTVPA